MAKSSKSITTDQVLESAKYLSSQSLRSMQAKLTATRKELLNLAETSSLNDLLSNKEKATLRQAATVVSTINDRIAHAKEKKQRDEKRREAIRKARRIKARQLARQSFSLPTDSAEQCVEVVRVALVLNHLRVLQDFYTVDKFAAKWLSKARETPTNWDRARHLRYEVRSLAGEVLNDVENVLAERPLDDKREVRTLLDILLAKVAEVRPQVLEQQAAVIECWTTALSEPGVFDG